MTTTSYLNVSSASQLSADIKAIDLASVSATNTNYRAAPAVPPAAEALAAAARGSAAACSSQNFATHFSMVRFSIGRRTR